jgi:Xaa-Pro dipeptidase
MISADGCKNRIQQLLAAVTPSGPLFLADPLHLRYCANYYSDPFSLGADYGAVLKIDTDGTTTLFHDHRVPKSSELAFADNKVVTKWYDGIASTNVPRRLASVQVMQQHGLGTEFSDNPLTADGQRIIEAVSRLRRCKQPDEIEQLRHCVRITEAGHAWARANVKTGMMELDMYTGISAACTLAAGHPVVVYGDFAVSPGSTKRGGMATGTVLRSGDTLILDFSVVIQGYRSDFTNTLVVGGQPTQQQQDLFSTCLAAMNAGEKLLHPGANCRIVYEAVRDVFASVGQAEAFPHHAGHGLGLGHPEAPFFVKNSTDTLQTGDVVTLEPGAYIDGVGGIRIEHNYLITPTGFEQLSQHHLGLT